jgi:hypothetical protein
LVLYRNMKQKIKTILIAVLTLVGVSYAQAEWVPPTEGPPNGNVPAPINAGDTPQTKSGKLTIAGGLNVGGVGVTSSSLVVEGEPVDGPNTFLGRLFTEGGLIIETRDGDVSDPEDGRMWLLREDL